MKQTRRNHRSLCADLIKVRWKDQSGNKRKEYASLEDISPGGACIQLDEPIAEGTVMILQYPSGKYQGRVKYSVFQRTGYFVGIEFEPGYHWSQRQYNPPHLLQLRINVGRCAK